MKLFAIAFGIACGVGVILFATTFAILTLVGIGEPVAAAAALGALPITTFPKIGEFLERQEGKKNLAAGKRNLIYDFRGFQIAWPLMALYGSLVFTGVLFMTGGFLGVVGMAMSIASGVTEEHLLQEYLDSVPFFVFSQSIGFVVAILVIYFIGRWIGTRCSHRGFLAVLLIVVLTFAVGFGMYPMIPDKYNELILILSIVEFPFEIFSGLIGYWRGRKYRLAAYLHYLLGVLPAETRDAVIELAFEEAQKVASAPATRR